MVNTMTSDVWNDYTIYNQLETTFNVAAGELNHLLCMHLEIQQRCMTQLELDITRCV